MKLVVVSDSHSEHDCLTHLKEKYEGKVDAMIHCGDSELSKNDPAIQGFATVRGNCDFGPDFPNELTLDIDGYRIFVTHGHLYNIKMTLMNLRYRARELDADFVFFGHSHELGAEMMDNTLILNPGSISLPRGPIRVKTYALIESVPEGILVKFMDDQDNELRELTQIFPLFKA
ncbi:phosphoesterase [Listeria floridensis FSL S10-1187]|uniref:Phosphoesterase n=1 Tax=Listeria floridensis FSL S10-1187 TaxID=1265817 RepID=A0ABN0RCH7_9LIST|nr:metallophosphoesterase [Listeria floridensis]EUJ27405.1 phosphoesterase [Listeria floridensis FSL S10-1187]